MSKEMKFIFEAKQKERNKLQLQIIDHIELEQCQNYYSELYDKEEKNSMKYCFDYIYQRRLKKVIDMAFQRFFYPDAIVEMKPLLPYEKDFYEDLLTVFPKSNFLIQNTVGGK